MTTFVYKFALLIAVVTYVLCSFGGISFFTSIFRSAIVFIGILFIFFTAAQFLNLGMALTHREPKTEDK